MILAKILYIYNILCFYKNQNKLQAWLNLNNKVNIIILVYRLELNFKAWKTNIKAWEIYSFAFIRNIFFMDPSN